MPTKRAAASLLRACLKDGCPNQQQALLFRSPFSTGIPNPNASVRPSPSPPKSTPIGSGSSTGPTPPPGAATAASEAPKSNIATLLIPLLGIPGLVAWYGWEILKQDEHDARINSVHDTIKDKMALIQERFGSVPTASKPSSAQPAPAPPAAVAPPSTSSSSSGSDAQPKQQPSAAKAEAKPPAVASKAATAAQDATPAPASSAAAGSTSGTEVQASKPAAGQAKAGAPTANTTASSSTAAAAVAAATSAADSVGAAADQVLGAVSKALQSHAALPSASHQAADAAAEPSPALIAAAPATAGDVPAGVPAPSAQLPSAPAAGYVPVLQSANEPEVPHVKKGEMGVTLDLSPSGLVQFANERGLGPGQDWAAFAEHHKQATADAELLSRAVQQISAWHQAEVAGLREEADAAAKRVTDILAKAKANTEGFKRLLRQHQEMATELRTLEVRQTEKRVSLAASQAAEQERQARIQALDEMRMQVGALAAAHDARVQQQAASHLSHSLTLTILALDHALEHGTPLKPHLNKLVARVQEAESQLPSAAAVITTAAGSEAGADKPAGASEELSLLKAIAGSIPATGVDKGVPTVQQLQMRLSQMKGSLAALSLLPEPKDAQSPGIISHALAGLIARFKVDESSSVRALGPDAAMATGSINAAIAAAELYLTDKRVLDALTVLKHATQGSAAAGAIDAWCADASARAAADQALKLLRAHATVLAASVV